MTTADNFWQQQKQLSEAVTSGDTDQVKRLLAAATAAGTLQELIAATEHGHLKQTLLHVAAEKGWTDIAGLLLAAGAQVNTVECRTSLAGYAPLHLAASKGHVDVLQLLLSAGAHIEHRNLYGECTALSVAAQYGQVDVLKGLLQAGAAIDSADRCGKTALMHAVMDDLGKADDAAFCKCAEALVAAGADVNARDEHGQTALHCLAAKSRPGRIALIPLLVSAGVEVDSVTIGGRTALHSAVLAFTPQPAAVSALLSAGAAADANDLHNSTPLAAAATLACAVVPRHSAEMFDCFMAHLSTSPLPPGPLVAAAAAAADWRDIMWGFQSVSEGRTRTVIRQLLSAAAVQQGVAAARSALLLHQPYSHWGGKVLTGVLLDMWLSAAADQEVLEAGLPARQQMVMRVAAEQAEPAAAAAAQAQEAA